MFIFYEEWRTQADIDAHLSQTYTQAFVALFSSSERATALVRCDGAVGAVVGM